jgi:hypothetical protein
MLTTRTEKEPLLETFFFQPKIIFCKYCSQPVANTATPSSPKMSQNFGQKKIFELCALRVLAYRSRFQLNHWKKKKEKKLWA